MSDWSSDVCSSDLQRPFRLRGRALAVVRQLPPGGGRLVDPRLAAAGLPGAFDQGFRTGFFVAVVDEFVGHGEAVAPLAGAAAGVEVLQSVNTDWQRGVTGKRVAVRVDSGG